MANKREFKKSVEALSSAIVDEMMASYYNMQNVDKDKILTAVTKILGAMETAKIDSNKLFDKGEKDFDSVSDYIKAKRQFNKNKFEAAVNAFNDNLGEALKDYNEATKSESAKS